MARAMSMAVALMLTTVVVQAQLPVVGSLMPENPSAMLTELEGMVRSGETPAFELITTIKGLIQDEIMPGLEKTQVSAAEDTAAALSAIDTCNSQSKTKEGQIEGTEELAVNNARSIHAACRKSEKSLYDHNLTDPNSDCVKLGKFLHGATPLEIPAGSDRSWSVQYVKDNAAKKMCGRSAVTELDTGCSAQESALAEEKAECATKQGSFERDLCTWKTALESNCEQLETCHSLKVAAYNSHVTVRKALVEKWNVETGALQKILCYCKVWLGAKDEGDQGDDRSKHNGTQFEVCKGQSYVPTKVNYGTAADKVPCLLTSVAEHPGTTGFETQEYSSFTDFFEPVDPCAEATTAAPTAGVPTTEATIASTECGSGNGLSWLLSGKGQNCLATCSASGLICIAQPATSRNGACISAVASAFGITCSAGSGRGNWAGNPSVQVPGNTCYYWQSENKQSHTLCSASSSSYRRFCSCQQAR